MTNISRYSVPLIVAVALPLGGCGSKRPETAPVRGSVTLDGQPVEGASVMLRPTDGGRPASGTTDAAGVFVLMTFEPGDGALPGMHRVAVAKVAASEQAVSSEGPQGPDAMQFVIRQESAQHLLPLKYASPETSGLEVQVSRGMGEVKLELTSR